MMLVKQVPIYFYLPKTDFPENVPENVEDYWPIFGRGIYSWTLQTHLNLKASGFPSELVSEIPSQGIILAHWDSLPSSLIPSKDQLFVCFQADRDRHPYAQVHIVQNREGLKKDTFIWGDRNLFAGKTYYMPHWPQPGLIKRRIERGQKFENLCFFGLEVNLLPEFSDQSWMNRLAEIGVKWHVVSDFNHWNDYSFVDAVLAVRNFRNKRFIFKPATKLFNAWHAEVPAILGDESAYRAERKSPLDYLEVTSVEATFEAVKTLKGDDNLRRAMVENGKRRARETDRAVLVQHWIRLLDHVIQDYNLWSRCSLYRALFKQRRHLLLRYRQGQ